MDNLQKELRLNRIIAGDLYAGQYIIRSPTRKLLVEADQVYLEIIEDNKFNDWLKEEEAAQIMVRMGILEADFEEKKKQIDKEIEEAKVSLYKDIVPDDTTRRRIVFLEKEYNKILNKELYLRQHTLEGFANQERSDFILSRSIYQDDEPIRDISTSLLSRLSDVVSSSAIPTSEFRELARSDQWRSIWGANKSNPFGRSPVELTTEQVSLITYSRLYDNVYEHSECPADDVIEDDYRLDGWLILQRRKRKKERKQDDVDRRYKKYASHQEVFVVAKSPEEAKAINKWNDERARAVKKSREDAVKKGGRLKEHELPDKQQDLRMAATNQYMQTTQKKR